MQSSHSDRQVVAEAAAAAQELGTLDARQWPPQIRPNKAMAGRVWVVIHQLCPTNTGSIGKTSAYG